MSYFATESLTVTTSVGGAATATTTGIYNGFLHSIVYTVDGTTPYSNGVVVTITAATSGLVLMSITLATNISTTWFPRAATHSTLGVASLYAATFAVTDRIPLAGEPIQVVLASGGNTLKGAFRFVVGG